MKDYFKKMQVLQIIDICETGKKQALVANDLGLASKGNSDSIIKKFDDIEKCLLSIEDLCFMEFDVPEDISMEGLEPLDLLKFLKIKNNSTK